MISLRILFPCCLLFLVSCMDNTANEKLAEADKIIVEKSKEIENLKEQIAKLQSSPSELIHLVLFQLKEGYTSEDLQKLSSLLESLKAVQSTNVVRVGMPTETNDPRAKKDYQMALLVAFDNLEKLSAYQKDAFHLEARKKVGPYLEGTPVVYDFTTN